MRRRTSSSPRRLAQAGTIPFKGDRMIPGPPSWQHSEGGFDGEQTSGVPFSGIIFLWNSQQLQELPQVVSGFGMLDEMLNPAPMGDSI